MKDYKLRNLDNTNHKQFYLYIKYKNEIICQFGRNFHRMLQSTSIIQKRWCWWGLQRIMVIAKEQRNLMDSPVAV